MLTFSDSPDQCKGEYQSVELNQRHISGVKHAARNGGLVNRTSKNWDWTKKHL